MELTHANLDEVMTDLRDDNPAAGMILDGLYAGEGETIIGIVAKTGIKGAGIVMLERYCAESNQKLSSLFRDEQAKGILEGLESNA